MQALRSVNSASFRSAVIRILAGDFPSMIVPEPNYSDGYHKVPDRLASTSLWLRELHCSDTLHIVYRRQKNAWLDVIGRKHWGGGWLEVVFGYQYRWYGVLPSFLFVSVAYQYRASIPRSAGILIAMIVALAIACHAPVDGIQQDVMARLIFPPTLAYFVFYAALANWGLPDAGRYGDFSYGTYLYAFPIQQTLASTLKHQIPFYRLGSISLVSALIAGICGWFAVERWFLFHKPNRLN
jgi:hypothetical protein